MNLFLKILLAPLIPVAVIVGIVILVGIVRAIICTIFGKGKTKNKPKEKTHELRETIEEKYVARGILEKYESSPWTKLIRLGKEALKKGDLEAAREYLEDSYALTAGSDAAIPLMECYVSAGEREKAATMLNKALDAYFPDEDILFQGILLHLTDQPLTVLEKGCAQATKYGNMRDDTYKLYCAAKEQIAKDALASCNAKMQEAQKMIRKGDPAGAAELCKSLYDIITKYTEKKDLPKYRETLTELAWQTAVYCCGAGTYQQYEMAEEYLNKENCSHYPAYYYIRMLAKTRGGVSGFEDTIFLHKALYTDVERAIREGLPGAEQVKERLSMTYFRALEIETDNARFEVEQMEAEDAFEEAHGMRREEYEERQKEKARAEREKRLREEFAWAERSADIITGGMGRSAEEKWEMNELSFADYARYVRAKERNIKKKSE